MRNPPLIYKRFTKNRKWGMNSFFMVVLQQKTIRFYDRQGKDY